MYIPLSPTPSLTRKNRSVNLLAEYSTVWESAPQSNEWPGVNPPPRHFPHFQYYIRVYLYTVSPKLIDKTVQNLNGQNSWVIDWSCVDELLEPPPWRHPNRFRTKSWFFNIFKMGFKTFNRVIPTRVKARSDNAKYNLKLVGVFYFLCAYTHLFYYHCLHMHSGGGASGSNPREVSNRFCSAQNLTQLASVVWLQLSLTLFLSEEQLAL